MKWKEALKIAEKYYKTHGNLLAPAGYRSDGLNLYDWISRQRRRYSAAHTLNPSGNDSVEEESEQQENVRQEKKNQSRGNAPLTEEQISALESIGMVWNVNDYAWERAFAVAEAYYREHGNLLVPTDYCADGVNLSSWIRTQRQIRNGTLKNRKKPLTEEQIRRLDSIGMPWQPYDSMWERSFAVAEKYYREHGNLTVPKHYEEDGVNLSHWIWAQRRIVAGTGTDQKLTEEQIHRLESIGMVWAPKSKGFSYYYDLCRKFFEEYGHTDFPAGELRVGSEILPERGETLATWKREQERGDFFEKNGGRAWERQRMLREIGIEPAQKLTAWEKKYHAAEAYYREHGDLLVPYSYVTEDGIHLGKWISNQRIKRRGTWGKPPTEEQIRKLDAIGMSWDETENRGKRKQVVRKNTEKWRDQRESRDSEESSKSGSLSKVREQTVKL